MRDSFEMTDRTAVMGSFSLCSYSAPVFNLIAESGRFDGKAAKRLGSSAIAAGWSHDPTIAPCELSCPIAQVGFSPRIVLTFDFGHT